MNNQLNNKIVKYFVVLFISCFFFSNCTDEGNSAKNLKSSPPNIIFILADDLGYGDISCNGQQKFQTPNIDAMAATGMKFTQHYSGSTVCAPSRSVIMTGLHTGHTPVRGNKEVKPEGQHPLAAEVETLAELLQKKGYKTGAFGKWGLGFPGSVGDPINQGFDQFFGYNCQRIAHNYYPYHLWDNNDKVMLKENEGDQEGLYAPDLIHEKTLSFIEENKDNPFFLFVPNVIPHAELKAPENFIEKYRGKLEPELAYEGCDPGCERYKIGGYGSQSESHATFAAMVDHFDMQVGEILAKLKELGIDENTLIMFSSDNGPHMEGGADPDFFDSNGIYRGYKRDLYEGGIRVPTIFNWPSKIKAGSTSDHISAFWDILPTFLDVAEIPTPEGLDGISFLPTLLGKADQKQHEYLYWEFNERGGRKALRKGDWKVVLYDIKTDNPKAPELYNIKLDPSEEQNLAEQNPEIVLDLIQLMENRSSSPIAEWNFE